METIVKILMNEKRTPLQKLADAELHFRGGDLDGLKLIGFAIWRRQGRNGCDVTFPSRELTVNGRRRRYALLRAVGQPIAQNRVRDRVLQVYTDYSATVPSPL